MPELPARLPRRWSAPARLLGRAVFSAAGWRFDGEFPDNPKLVTIVAPHTSNWDFIVGIAAVLGLGLRASFLGKDSLFKPPLGWLMTWFGGTPVIRESPQGAVGQVVARIESEPNIFLAITPSGTRSSVVPWRSGFYHIAHAAGVPIFPIAFDGEHKVIRLFAPFRTTGDYDADVQKILALYAGIRGIKD